MPSARLCELSVEAAAARRLNEGLVRICARAGPIRLSVALSTAGVASRRAAEDIIRDGRVQVNGETVELPQHMVDGKRDSVVVDGRPLNTVSTHLYYFAINKPKGCAVPPDTDTHARAHLPSVVCLDSGHWVLLTAEGAARAAHCRYVCSNRRQGGGKIVDDLFTDWRADWEKKMRRKEGDTGGAQRYVVRCAVQLRPANSGECTVSRAMGRRRCSLSRH